MSKKFLKLFSIVVVLFAVLSFPFFVSPVHASINNQINFQGKLVNSNGTNVTDGSYTVVFNLYNVASGGTSIWSETDNVTTSGGIFQVALGANTSLPGNVDFNNSNLYLGITVGADSEMTPRIRFAAVPYAFNASTLDGVVATQSATGFSMQGGTSTSSVLSVTTAGGALTFQPGVAEGLTIESNGSNGLTLDTGGSGAITVGNNNATSFVFGKTSNNPSFNFNNGTNGFSVNGSGTITLAALNTADGLVYTSGTNGVLSQTAPTSSSQCLQSNSTNTGLTWISCSSAGTNYLQLNSGAIAPFSTTADLLLGGTATNSARFAFINNIGSGTPTASISANLGNNATYLTGTGILSTTNAQTLTLGSASTGNIVFQPGGQAVGKSLYLGSNGTVGIGTANPLATFDIRANSGTLPVASVSGSTSFAGLIVNNSGVGDIFTASKSGAIKFVIQNNGNIGFAGTNTVLSTLASAATSAQTWTLPNATGTVCVSINNCGFAMGTNEWQQINGAISPTTITDDVLLGGTATASARFAFINDIGAGTPTASISANSGNNAATYLTGTGILSTTNNQSLTLGSATTGNVVINPGGGSAEFTAFTNGLVGIGSVASPLASLDIRASSGTLAIASVSGSSSFAGLVVNNSGPGDLITASSSGITRFRMTNNGSTVFQGDTITSIGSVANNSAAVSDTNDSAVTNAIGDEGSLVPNSGFESAITANKTTNVAAGPVADGWIATATMSAAVTRIATDSAKGSASVMMKLNASQSTSISSVCIPLSLKISAIYNLNFYGNASNTSPVVRGFIDGFANKANCQSNTTPATFIQGSVTASTTGWKIYGGATAITTTGTDTWGRVRIAVNCPASCPAATTVEVDGIRLIETSNAVGVDYAEEYPADPNDIPQPGDVVSLEASGSASFVAKSHIPMDQSLMGVVSTNPGEDLDDGSISGPKVPVALAGRVPVNVSTANGPIQVGDYLTASNIPGVAVKATSAGQVIGTAMEDDTDSNTSDVTQITMFIKNTYYAGGPSSTSGLNLLSGGQDPSILLTMLQDAMTASSSALTSLSEGQVTVGLNYLSSILGTSSAALQEIASSSSNPRNNLLYTDNVATVSGLTVNGSATVSSDFRVQGNALIEGILHIADTLFANNIIANGVSDFFGNVIFHSNVTFQDVPTFNGNTAGFAVITKGSDHVDVKFSKPYDQTPIINASITLNPITPTPSETVSEQEQRQTDLENALLNSNIHYIITDRTANGFTILLKKPAQEDISFSWIALEVSSPVIFQSSGGSVLLPSPTENISPSPIDTVIPTNNPISSTPIPTEGIVPIPTPGG